MVAARGGGGEDGRRRGGRGDLEWLTRSEKAEIGRCRR